MGGGKPLRYSNICAAVTLVSLNGYISLTACVWEGLQYISTNAGLHPHTRVTSHHLYLRTWTTDRQR